MGASLRETGSRADASSPQAVSTKGFDPARKLDDKEAFYFRSIMGNLRNFRTWVLEEQQMVTLGSEVLDDNIDWLDCWLMQRGLDHDA